MHNFTTTLTVEAQVYATLHAPESHVWSPVSVNVATFDADAETVEVSQTVAGTTTTRTVPTSHLHHSTLAVMVRGKWTEVRFQSGTVSGSEFLASL
jgi:hypothetical protein